MVVRDKCIKVTCGDATQRVRWLGHVGIARYDEKNYQGWKILGVPTKITNREGLPIVMGGLISDVLKDGDTVYVSHSLEPHDVPVQLPSLPHTPPWVPSPAVSLRGSHGMESSSPESWVQSQ